MRLRAIAIVLAVVGAFVLVTAAPSSAGQQLATLSGDFECTTPGTFTVFWTIENLVGADGEVESAVLSGAAEGDLSDAWSPNPFSSDDLSTSASGIVSGDTVGTVTLEATVVFQLKGDFEVDLSADVELDGSCEAPPETDPATTEAPSTSVQEAATTRPSFTG
jgi:hypothetical protein